MCHYSFHNDEPHRFYILLYAVVRIKNTNWFWFGWLMTISKGETKREVAYSAANPCLYVYGGLL